jgi:hypothetical protein
VSAILKEPAVLIAMAVAAFLWLRSNNANPIVEQVLAFIRSLTNTPAAPVKEAVVDHKHMDSLVGRITCAQCLAEEFRKRGKGDVAKAITEAIGELAKEGIVA